VSDVNILNLDEVLSQERIVQLTERSTGVKRKIDVTNIPARVILELTKRESDLKEKAQSEDEGLFDWMTEIAIKICKPSFPEITLDWIMDNMNFNQLQQFLKFVLQPLDEYIKEAAEAAKKQMATRATTPTSSARPRKRRK
jgi:hypothetical protein